MLIVICSILVVLLVVSIWMIVQGNKHAYKGEGLWAGGLFLLICAIFALIIMSSILIANIASISTAHTIDSKIAMYEEENARIEEKINLTIENYLGHEEGIFENLSPETATTLLVKYPELKSDELVASQIDTYIANNEKIKSLKEDKINISVKKWWVYFGH